MLICVCLSKKGSIKILVMVMVMGSYFKKRLRN